MPLEMTYFQRMVATEEERARVLYGPFNSKHEAYAVILEELEELWNDIKLKGRTANDTVEQLHNLSQVTAMCNLFAEEILIPELNERNERETGTN